MFIRPEDVNAAFFCPERLHPFENGLSVMENQRGRQKRKGPKGNDLRLLPAPFRVVADEHMVGRILTQLQMVPVYLLGTRPVRPANGDVGDQSRAKGFHDFKSLL